jgi:NitT/TauT family transport system permease protein
VARVLERLGIGILVLAGICGLYSGYRWLWMQTGWTKPFAVDDITMPSLWSIVSALFDPVQADGQLLISYLLESALFTAKEAALGFALGTVGGFALGAMIAQFRVLQRGLMPYVVASQTIPILAIAPMVVVGLGNIQVGGWTPTDWLRVSIIAAYLTFFPVTVNTVRGLQSADPTALELMRSYAASNWTIFWKLRIPSAVPYLFGAFRVAATASVVGAIIGELPSSIQDGLGGAILNFNQYYVLNPQNLWATNLVAAALGIAFFLVVVITERLVVHRPPERMA